MMKKFLMLFAFILGATTISAQSVKKADLVGTWQLCNMIDGMLDSSPEIKRCLLYTSPSPRDTR